MDLTPAERQMLGNPNWRELITRQAAAAMPPHNQFELPIIADTLKTLNAAVVHAPDGETAIVALRRLKRVRSAFGSMSHTHQEALAGRLLVGEGMMRNGQQQAELLQLRKREAWLSHPDLAALLAEREQAAERRSAALAEDIASLERMKVAAETRRLRAPAIVLDLHSRNIRLDVLPDGRPVGFPRSNMTDADVTTFITHGVEIADAILAERFTA